RLGVTLTPMGANPSGNEQHTIPAYTGKIEGAPEWVEYKGSGHYYPSAYPDDKPLFVIDGSNYKKYQANLTDGQLALFAAYPSTFRMPVYPSRRDARYSDFVHQQVKLNAVQASLAAGGNGVLNSFGPVPFPLPKNGMELIQNNVYAPNMYASSGSIATGTVYKNGEILFNKRVEDRYFEIMDPSIPRERFSGLSAQVMLLTTFPPREKGKVILVHEFADLNDSPRNAWIYQPGTRRVRRAPTIAYDFPDGPGGLRTVDDALMFNGATDRFTWIMQGKRELYIPYNNNELDSPAYSYEHLLTPSHLLPDVMRYELHRCWVLTGELIPGKNHIYSKRKLYLDEDSWSGVLTENYNRAGELFRVGMRTMVNLYDMPGMGHRVELYHDLQNGAYMANGLINEEGGPPTLKEDKWDSSYFTPATLRQLGKR
ncbi:MAG: DUF1329 domain-containing protein, partial [Pseudomonadales bacterium]|nr:DUF1329 domain-containing protein [Pseudomonadales bacterium]